MTFLTQGLPLAPQTSTDLGIWVGIGLSVLALLLLLALLFAGRRRDQALGTQVSQMQDVVARQLHEVREQSTHEAARDREELSANLKGMNDSLMTMIGEMTRTQQTQLDSFGGQLRAVNRDEEQRMEHMRQVVNQQLGAYDQKMEQVARVLEEKLTANDQRMERMRDTLQEGLNRLQQDNALKLEQMRLTVDEKLHATLDRRLGESFQLVSDRLELVSKGLGEMQSLASGVGDLKRVLTNVKTRGTWGEVQLGALLEQILSPGQYQVNVQVKPDSQERVEFAIAMPGREGQEQKPIYLPIDAKFPVEDYNRLLEASERGEQAAVEAAAKALEGALLRQGKRIQEKYIDPPHTTDYALMYLPTEGLYAEALRTGSLAEQLQNQFRVIIAGPTTLAALLNSLQMGFRTLAIEKRSSEVWALLGAVKTEYGRFADILTRTQKKLRQASDSIEDAARKTRTIQRRLREVSDISDREARYLLPAEEEDDMAALEAGESEELAVSGDD